jgi:predicted HicB family RNase H-like nuclease
MVAKPNQKSIRVDAKVHEAAKKAAEASGLKLYAFVETALRLAVEDHQQNLRRK